MEINFVMEQGTRHTRSGTGRSSAWNNMPNFDNEHVNSAFICYPLLLCIYYPCSAPFLILCFIGLHRIHFDTFYDPGKNSA